MDTFIVAVIVAVALGFTIRGFVKIYRGEERCSCGGCSCGSNSSCPKDFPVADKD